MNFPKLAITVLALLPPAVSFADISPTCSINWQETRQKIHQLLKVSGCSTAFSVDECKRNLGLVDSAAAVGIGGYVGTEAGNRIRLNPPKLCGLTARNFSPLLQTLLPEAMASSCVNPASDLAKQLREAIDAGIKDRAGNVLTEQTLAYGRQNVEAARLEERLRRNTEILTEKSKIPEIKAEIAKLTEEHRARNNMMSAESRNLATKIKDLERTMARIEADSKVASEAVKESSEAIAAKFKNDPKNKALFDLYMETHYTDRLSANPDRMIEIAKQLANDASLADKQLPDARKRVVSQLEHIKTLQELRSELQRGTPTPERLAQIWKVAEPISGGEAKMLFAKTMTQIAERFPNIRAPEWAAKYAAGGFRATIADLVPKTAQAGANLAKGAARTGAKAAVVGGALAAHPAFAAATEIADQLGSPSQVACESGGYSSYATLESTTGGCLYVPALDEKMRQFLELPEGAQQEELCKYPGFMKALNELHDQLYPSNMKATCDGTSGMSIVDGTRNIRRQVKWSQNGDLQTVTATGPGLNGRDHSVRFADGTIERMRVRDPRAKGGGPIDFWDTANSKGSVLDIESKDIGVGEDDLDLMVSLRGTASRDVAESIASNLPVMLELQSCCSGGVDKSDPRCTALGSDNGSSPSSKRGSATSGTATGQR